MTKTLKYFLIGLVAVVVLLLVIGSLSSKSTFGSLVQPINPIFTNGLRAGLSGTQVINSSAQYVGQISTSETVSIAAGKFTLGATSATWNPSSFSSSSVASTSVAVSGAVLGDGVIATFASATSSEQWRALGNVLANGTVVVNLFAIPGTAAYTDGLDISTSTVYVRLLK